MSVSPSTRASRRRAPGLRALAAVIACAAAPGPARAEEMVHVQVGTVYATNSGEHVDASLKAMHPQLSRVFHYTSYRLVKQEARDVGWGDPVDVPLPGERFLRVMPKSAGGDRVSLDVMLRKRSRVLMDTEFTVRPHGTVMVGGPRHEDGVLIIWIGAQRVAPAGDRIGPAGSTAAGEGEK